VYIVGVIQVVVLAGNRTGLPETSYQCVTNIHMCIRNNEPVPMVVSKTL